MPRSRFFNLFRRERNPPPTLVMAWYREDQWPRLREVSVDAARLENTYGEWLKVAQARYDELVRQGTPVEKVDVEVEDLFAWCRELGRQVDNEGRAMYAVYRFKIEHEKRPGVGPDSNLRPKPFLSFLNFKKK